MSFFIFILEEERDFSSGHEGMCTAAPAQNQLGILRKPCTLVLWPAYPALHVATWRAFVQRSALHMAGRAGLHEVASNM